MIVLILILLAINLPLGYFLCRKWQLKRYLHILLLGLAQYLASALVVSLITNLNRKTIGLTAVYETGGMFLWGSLAMFPYVGPIVFLSAWGFYYLQNRRWFGA